MWRKTCDPKIGSPFTQPHPHAALFETGRCDYALAVPILYDYYMRREGELVDRNGGAARDREPGRAATGLC